MATIFSSSEAVSFTSVIICYAILDILSGEFPCVPGARTDIPRVNVAACSDTLTSRLSEEGCFGCGCC